MTAAALLRGRKILLLNWRDRTHPDAGGAEVYCEQIGRRFAEAGAEVTFFTSRYPGAVSTEMRDGMTIIRGGGTLGVYLRAALHLITRRRHYDAILDFQNGIPFFAPLVARRTAIVLAVHHVHQDQFRHRFPWPLSRLGQVLEGPASRLIYGDRPVVAVSPSTRKDVRLRLGLRGPIHVVPNGLNPNPAPRCRAERPRIVIVTRLAPHKRLSLVVDALAQLRQSWPDLELHIAGVGADRERIAQTIQGHGLGASVHMHGRISDQDRDELLASAWLTVLPSEAEGWGLTVVEANGAGVPAVALDVPGLRDAVLHGSTGWIARDPIQLPGVIDAALRELAEPDRATAWEQRCRQWASNFSWERTAHDFCRITLAEVARVEANARERRGNRDVSVVGWLAPVGDAHGTAAAILKRVRSTDSVTVNGSDVTVVLHSTDEVRAERLIRAAGFNGDCNFRVMRPHERLWRSAPRRPAA